MAVDANGTKQVLLNAGKKFLEMTRANFGLSGPTREKPWPPLSKAYAKKVGSNSPTDKRSGKLMNSITLGPVQTDSVEIYTRNAYAAAIAFGDPKKRLPARNYWPIENHGSPNLHRLTIGAERELYINITTTLNKLSSGVLPNQTMPPERSPLSQGLPWGL